MQETIAPPDLRPVHRLLNKHAVPDDLVVVRLSSRANRLIFKSSVIKEMEMPENRIPWIKTAQQHVRDGQNQLNPTQITLKADEYVEGRQRNKSTRITGGELT